MERVYKNNPDCCGCEACANVCPKQAITMQPDKYGFIYPVINSDVCINCKLCKKVCALKGFPFNLHRPLATYACTSKNTDVVINSASGGVFVALASIVFEQNGVVFGCAWNSNMEPEHICIDKSSDIKDLQGSKYVQSSINDTYVKVEKYLKNGMHVLFTGTPCQVAALKSFLGREYAKLITADLICHGVPSQAFFKDYISYLENELNGKIIDLNFRDKSNGWSLLAKVTYKKDSKIYYKKIPNSSSYYYTYFLYGDIYRDSCYECKYACGNRQGDFTMGDYWGVEKVHPNINTKYGVSVLLVNNEKGMSLIDRLKNYLHLTTSTFEQVMRNNAQLCHPIPMSLKRDKILNLWRSGGSEALARNFKVTTREKLINIVRTYLPYSIKAKIKSIL